MFVTRVFYSNYINWAGDYGYSSVLVENYSKLYIDLCCVASISGWALFISSPLELPSNKIPTKSNLPSRKTKHTVSYARNIWWEKLQMHAWPGESNILRDGSSWQKRYSMWEGCVRTLWTGNEWEELDRRWWRRFHVWIVYKATGRNKATAPLGFRLIGMNDYKLPQWAFRSSGTNLGWGYVCRI